MFGLFSKGKKKKKKTPKKQIKKVSNASKSRKRTNGKVNSIKKEANSANNSVKNQSKANIAIIPEEIKNNPWNVHNNRKTQHPVIVLESGKENVLISRSSSTKVDNSWFALNDGLTPNQNEPSYVNGKTEKLSKTKLQRKLKDSRITPRDKQKIFENLKKHSRNYKNYEEILKEKKN